LCADASAQWHSSWLDAYGVPWRRGERAWVAEARPPFIYLGGITLSADATEADVRGAPGSIYDSWGRLALEPYGFEQWRVERWFIRPPGAVPDAPDPPELEIVRAGDAEVFEFEAVSARGFGGESPPPVAAGTYHRPNPDPRMTLWLGRVDGEAVSAAMSYETEATVGIFGVATIEPARGRGYATALMRRAILAETGLPSVLNTDSPEAARIYEGLGFREIGQYPQWRPGPVKRTDPDAERT